MRKVGTLKMAESSNRNMRSLKDEQQVRQRANIIFGTVDINGAFKCIDEIVANSVDEASEGYGNEIRVTVSKPTEEDIKLGARDVGDVIEIEDDGRGLPMDWNEDEQKYNWELACCTLYASGKYDSSQYSQSVGLNGLGLTATQYASSFMTVESTYDGKTRCMKFQLGKPVGQMKTIPANREGTGTKIRFQTDYEVFPCLQYETIDMQKYLSLFNNLAMINSGLTIKFNHYDLNREALFHYDNGIVEYIDRVLDDPESPSKPMIQTAFYTDTNFGTDDPNTNPELYKFDMELAFNFCRDKSVVGIYHNGSHLFEGGTTANGFEQGFTKALTDAAVASGKMPKAERFLYRDIEQMLVCTLSTKSPGYRTNFKSQTKSAVTNPWMGKATASFIYDKVRYWVDNNKTASDKVIAEVLVNKKAREDGEAVSKKVIKKLSSTVNFTNKPKGFEDCASKDVSIREVYLVEGLSALGSAKQACDSNFQAVMPLRGKVINSIKETPARVLNNDIVINLFRILGCGIELKTKYLEDLPKFDINKLRWNKIIICTDADVDGFHIRCLLLELFYVLAPSLIKEGKVFIAETPLYEMSYKDDYKFAYDDNEHAEYMKYFTDTYGINPNKVTIKRSKGLGENDADMMHRSTMNPETRRLVKIQWSDDEDNLRVQFNSLLGNDIESRRMLINEYFDKIDADLE
jgi:DNA gyrase subunit B